MAAVIVVFAGVVLWLDIAAIRSHLRRTAPLSGRVVEPAPHSSSLEHRLDQTCRRLVTLLDLRACWFEPFPFDTTLPRIERARIVAPADEPGSPPISYTSIELPVCMDGLTLGRIVLLPTAQSLHDISSPRARETAIAMADELAGPVAAALRTGDLSRSAG